MTALHNNNNKFIPDNQEWEPSMFSIEQVKEIEESWQYAMAVMSHFRLDKDFISSLRLEDDDEDSDEEEEPLVTLSPVERLSTPEGYENCNDVVQEAVRRDPRALVWASERLRNQGYLWLPVIRRDARLVRYLTKACRYDVEFCLRAVQVNPEAIHYVARSCCYDPRILGAAWQGDHNDYLAFPYPSSTSSSSANPMFPETFPGERTGSLLRFATVVLGLEFGQARTVARQYDCLSDFDRWDNDLQVLQAVARRRPERLPERLGGLFAIKSSSGHATTAITAVTSVNKSPFRTLHKTSMLTPTWTAETGRGRHVRKFSETQ